MGRFPPSTRRSMKGSATRSSRRTSPLPATAVSARRYRSATPGFIRNSISETSIAANSAMPTRSTARFAGGVPNECFGRRSEPSTRQASDNGMLTVKTSRQPPAPMSSPPSVGPMTTTPWLATESAVRTPVGLSCPVRSASLRVRYMDAGYAADVPNPSSTRAAISTPREGARAPRSPAIPTSAVPVR